MANVDALRVQFNENWNTRYSVACLRRVDSSESGEATFKLFNVTSSAAGKVYYLPYPKLPQSFLPTFTYMIWLWPTIETDNLLIDYFEHVIVDESLVKSEVQGGTSFSGLPNYPTASISDFINTPITNSSSSQIRYIINDVVDLPVVEDKGPSYYRTYSISNSLTNCVSDNSDTSIATPESYNATITATTGYYFESSNVSVMMGSTAITPTFASDSKSFTIDISAPITGNLVITASATAIPPEPTYYSVTNTLSHCTNGNPATQILENAPYNTTITANTYYKFDSADVLVYVGSTVITPTFAADNKSFSFTVNSVTNNISITATAIPESTPSPPTRWHGEWQEISSPNSEFYVVSSQIKQTLDDITLKVSKGEISSQLSIESDQIVLESGRLIIESGNFQIDEYGNITAREANLSGMVQTTGDVQGYQYNPTWGEYRYYGYNQITLDNGLINYTFFKTDNISGQNPVEWCDTSMYTTPGEFGGDFTIESSGDVTITSGTHGTLVLQGGSNDNYYRGLELIGQNIWITMHGIRYDVSRDPETGFLQLVESP